MKKIIAILAVGLMLSGVVNTASAAVAVRYSWSCGAWAAEQAKSNSLYYQKWWLIGFMSGLALGKDDDILEGTDPQSIYLWMDNYCKANPLNDITYGGVDLYYELKKQKNIK